MKPDAVLLITGAANGIGAAATELLVSQGHRVVAADVNEIALAALAKRLGDRVHALQLDVRNTANWERALDEAWDRFGAIDVLVNNAGLIHTGWVREQTLEEMEHMIEVNLLGVIKGMRAALPRLLAQGRGHVVNVASLAAFFPLKGQTVYSATKHAVRAFHHGCALEYADTPITFSLVCPGAVDTGMLRQQIGQDSNALAFADEALTAQAVAEAICRAARDKPAEILLPALRGEVIRIAGVYPWIGRRMIVGAERRGLAKLEKLRKSGAGQ